MIRAIVLSIALLTSFPAYAVPCWIIRKAVAEYGEAAVEAFARARGATDKQIEAHKKCLK